MVNKYDFDKQFGNMGIDRESIMNANKKDSAYTTTQEQKNSLGSNEISTGQTTINSSEDEAQELMIVKRKLEYLQTNILKRFEEKFAELEQKIEEKNSKVIDYSRDIAQMRNEISDLKQKLSSVRVSFGNEPSNTQSAAPVQSQPAANSSSENNSAGGPMTSAQAEQAKVRVEDYFNFSNKKF